MKNVLLLLAMAIVLSAMAYDTGHLGSSTG